jgi:dTDP-4-dehydrorhamnose reductase
MIDAQLPSAIYHATAEGYCSWFEFASTIMKIIKGKAVVKPIQNPNILRPKYSVLENKNLKVFKSNIFTDWKTSLERYLAGR